MMISPHNQGFTIPNSLWNNWNVPMEYKCTQHLWKKYPPTDPSGGKEIPQVIWGNYGLTFTEKMVWIAIRHFTNADSICDTNIFALSEMVIMKDSRVVTQAVERLRGLCLVDRLIYKGKASLIASLPSEDISPYINLEARRIAITTAVEVHE